MKKIKQIKKNKKNIKVFFKYVDNNIMKAKINNNFKNESEIKNEKINYYFNDDLLNSYVFFFHQIFISNTTCERLAVNHLTLSILDKKARIKMRLEKTYISFKELKNHLTSNKADTLTFFVDQILLKANTLKEIEAKIIEVKKTTFKTSNDFKSIAIIKKHIRYRQNHNRIVFSKNKKDQIRMINIDYKSEASQESLF